ncbi:hypothetical protein [Streptomyces sp. NPDC051211]|uniref:hypothetical protein n=1 Tax=Streptomyces sp. NPDC051211 TaxID=3154643 RepID=UPI00344CFB78
MNHTAPRLRTAVRLAAPAVAALTLTMAFAGPASANPAFVSRSGGQVNFSALPGEQNTVTFTLDANETSFLVGDSTSTLVAGPGCTQLNPNVVSCGPAAGVTRIRASLGDGDDFVSNTTSIPSDLLGGTGDDRLFGGEGPDRISDPDGSNSVHLLQTIDGRGGNDTIISRNGRFDTIQCGPGFDVLLADRVGVDTVLGGCEFVQRF